MCCRALGENSHWRDELGNFTKKASCQGRTPSASLCIRAVERVALITSAGVLRCSTWYLHFLRVLHNYMIVKRKCVFPTYAALMASYSRYAY